MGTVGALSFLVPWALVALVGLPVIWWLLRVNPPTPRRIIFPPIVLLQRLTSQRESPARIPPWLLFLRLALAALLILGTAGPFWNAEMELEGVGPIYLIIDDGWSASNGWSTRQATMRNILDHAERHGRPVVVTTTAPLPEGAASVLPQMQSAGEARRMVEGLQPKPWGTDRARAFEALLSSDVVKDQVAGDAIWLSDGLEEDGFADGSEAAITHLAGRLQQLGAVTVYSNPSVSLPVVLRPPQSEGVALMLEVRRVRASSSRGVQVRALAEDGEVLGRLPLVFAPGAAKASGSLVLDTRLRNKVARLEITDSQTVGGVVLMDERWRRRPVGLLSATGDMTPQPLLDALHYLGQAIGPYAEVRTDNFAELFKRDLAVLIMADPGRLDGDDVTTIQSWIDQGGVLLRFAGPRLAREAGISDPLLPVQLRPGGRAIGGALSWRKPESLAPFPASSPFHGLPAREDVKIRRQVLAQPSLDLADKTWARLGDGTPLVTAAKRGQGWIVLVHTTANAEWSDLAFSGLYVGMLQRLIRLSQGVASKVGMAPLAPVANLDAFGRLGKPPGGATGIPGANFAATGVSPWNPPGFYGTIAARRALNLSQSLRNLIAVGTLPAGVRSREYVGSRPVSLKSWLLGAAALLFLLDLLASMWMRGLLGVLAPRTGAFLMVMGLSTGPAVADDEFAKKNSVETRIAFVITGDRRIDQISEAGLTGLNMILWQRTAAELGPPQGINPALDDLTFFPLLYWPVVPGYSLPRGAAARVVEYQRNGGTILFDTRDQASDTSGGTLARLSRELEIPQLVPVPGNHVLTKSFYLLREFPGRWTGGMLWVEKAGERINDGVSSVIAGSHDWAAAWAVDDEQRPIFPVVPGGERQREIAYRFGINLVMYTLTGNYKADQVHMPSIIQRLGK